MKRIFGSIIGWLVLFVAFGSALAMVGAADQPMDELGAVASPATPVPAPETVEQERGYLGVIVAGESVDVAARSNGWIEKVHVRMGDEVEAGAVIATIDDTAIRSELAIAEATLAAARAGVEKARFEHEQARERLDRRRDISESGPGVLSREELADAEYKTRYTGLSLSTAQQKVSEHTARVSALRNQLGDTVVRAPFAGVVATRYIDTGTTMSRGSPIARIVSTGDLRVRFAIPESHGGRVAPGMAIDVRLDEGQLSMTGEISHMAPEVDIASRMIIVEATLQLPHQRPRATLTGHTTRVFVRSS